MKKFAVLFVTCLVVSVSANAQSLPVKATNSSVVFETVTSGINEISLESSIDVYPVPAVSELMVAVNQDYSLSNCELFVMDVTGKTVIHEKNVTFKNGNLVVDVKNLSNGIYTLVLNPKDNKVAINKRFVVSK